MSVPLTAEAVLEELDTVRESIQLPHPRICKERKDLNGILKEIPAPRAQPLSVGLASGWAS